jgi:hypothetical protein
LHSKDSDINGLYFQKLFGLSNAVVYILLSSLFPTCGAVLQKIHTKRYFVKFIEKRIVTKLMLYIVTTLFCIKFQQYSYANAADMATENYISKYRAIADLK